VILLQEDIAEEKRAYVSKLLKLGAFEVTFISFVPVLVPYFNEINSKLLTGNNIANESIN